MDDLISRQAAIDAVIKHLQLDYEYAWGVREAINGLPTADSSEFCDNLWKIAYEHGKRDAQPSVITMKIDVDKEHFRKVMEECELTFAPSEIVRCKNCRWWGGSSNTCGHWDGMVIAPANGFCSYGERKSDG